MIKPLKNNNPITTSEIVAIGIKKSHKSVTQLIKDYENDLNEFGTLSFLKRQSTGGRPSEFYYLNEQHVTFLITLMRNTKTVVEFKKAIVKQFFSMRKWILDQKTQKAAKSQGSKSADKYYMNFSKMENSAFFILQEKFPNVREILSITQLSKIIIADIIVKQAIVEGMEKEMFYKDIFQLAKKRIIELANSLGFKEILPGIEFKQIGPVK